MTSEFSRAEFELRNRGPWTVLSVRDWPGLSLGQTTALGGGRSPSLHRPDTRLAFSSLFDVVSYHEAEQVHGNDLRSVGGRSGCYPGTDGLFAARPRVMLTMRTADCYPVFVKSEDDRRFGLLHAGWRGLRRGIVRQALDRWFSRPVDVLLGSGIGVSEYEVGEEVVEAFVESCGLSESELRQRDVLEGRHLNLPVLIRRQVERSDVQLRSLRKLPPSTSGDTPPMLSYRLEGTDDRMVSWIYAYGE